MEEQLPIPLNELLILNLYPGSITHLLGIAFVLWVMKKNKKISWLKFFLIALLLVVSGCVSSMLIWSVWDSEIDVMSGPIHLPTLISLQILAVFLLKTFGYKIIVRNPMLNKS
jgi:uncharacterized membrane protein